MYILSISMIIKFITFLIESHATYILSMQNIKLAKLLVFNNAYGHAYLYV